MGPDQRHIDRRDLVYPVSQLVDETFKEGSTLSFQWRSDRYRHWSARNTRLFVEYEAMYGECNETCSNVVTGPDDKAARPSRSLRVTSMPNANLFSSQARFVQNNVTVETTNHLLRTQVLANITGRSLSPGQPQLVLAQSAPATAADVEMELSMRPGAAPFSVSVRALGVPVSLACSPASPPTRPVGSCTLFTPGRGRGRKTNRQVSFSVYFYTQIIADVIAHFTGDLSSRRNIYG